MLKSKKQTQKELDAAMLSLNTVLRELYTNKSSDEFKMKGDITKSSSYHSIETMIADLSSLKGYNQNDAADLKQLFTTLHRPIFKTMVKEYIMEPNDRNTVFTATFTMGYRLLTGELARIFSSTESTPKGIVYKPDKNSRKKDASKMIKMFNADLERKLDSYVKSQSIGNDDKPVNESYLTEILKGRPEEPSDETVQEGVGAIVAKGASGIAGALAKGAAAIAPTATNIGIISASVGMLAGLFAGVGSIFRGLNPVADVNYLFMNSYEKKISKLSAVAAVYEETKKAYEEYMKIPEAKRQKKVESKYIQNMEKYNITMQNLAAEIEHFNQRAEKESQEHAKDVKDKLPDDSSNPQGGDSGNGSDNPDDDFQF
jgi:hypothetical protein